MNEATIALTVMTALIFLVFLGFLVWGWRSGQFRNVEEAKHTMLEDEDRPADAGKQAAAGSSRRAPTSKGGHKT